jgi:hypothetical protein
LHSKDTCVHIVSLLEDMPVTEAVEALAELREDRLPVGAIVVNRATTARLPQELIAPAAAGKVDPAALAAGLRAAGIDADKRTVAGLAAEVRGHARRLEAEQESREELAGTGLPMLTFPRFAEGVQLGEVYQLADLLTDAGVGS